MKLEQNPDLRKRPCVTCSRPYGKWTCCLFAWCSTCVANHVTTPVDDEHKGEIVSQLSD